MSVYIVTALKALYEGFEVYEFVERIKRYIFKDKKKKTDEEEEKKEENDDETNRESKVGANDECGANPDERDRDGIEYDLDGR